MAKQPKSKAAADAAEPNAGAAEGENAAQVNGPRPLDGAESGALARLTAPGAELTLKGLSDALGELLMFADTRAAHDDERHGAAANGVNAQAEYIDEQVAAVRDEIGALRTFAETQLADMRKDIDAFKSSVAARAPAAPAGGAAARDPDAVDRFMYHPNLHARRVRSAAALERARADGFHDTPRAAAEAAGLPPEKVAAKAEEIHKRGAEAEVRQPGQ